MRLPNFASSLLLATAAGCAGLYAGYTVAAQPQMQSALAHLEAAEKDLRQATKDKGGHRDRALELVQKAEHQVREGIRYDKGH